MAHQRHVAIEAAKRSPIPRPMDVAMSGLRDPGESLPATSSRRQQFPGYDLSTIRLHSGPDAQRANERLHSRAYTFGEHIVIGQRADDGLLAHEVTHVLQQRRGGTQGEVEANEHAARSIEAGARHAPPRDDAVNLSSGVPAIVALAPNQAGTTDPSYIRNWVRTRASHGATPQDVLGALSEAHGGNTHRYFYTRTYGWVDVRHFGRAAATAVDVGSVATEILGLGNEVHQWLTEWGGSYRSGFSAEDVPSNAAGAEFGDDYVGARPGENLAEALDRWLADSGALPASDPAAGRAALPVSDPAAHGGADRVSGFSRTQSTASDAATEQATSGRQMMEQLNNPWAWTRGG